jgi:hypothetical protein
MQGGEQEGSTAWVIIDRISYGAAASGQFFQQSHTNGIAEFFRQHELLSFFYKVSLVPDYILESWNELIVVLDHAFWNRLLQNHSKQTHECT